MKTQLHVELLRHTYEPNDLVAAAAKLCYSSADINTLLKRIGSKDQYEFINKLMDMHHESPLEHVTFTFGIEGVSRTLLAQITRHRLASFSVQSQRYVPVKGDFNYIIPPRIEALGQEAVENYEAQMHVMAEWYHYWQLRLGNNGESTNEDARFVLPGACETKLMCTMNVRELLHFFSLRCCSRAQWEIRALANEMWRLCYQVAPQIFANAGAGCIRGNCTEGAKCCGKAKEMREARRVAINGINNG